MKTLKFLSMDEPSFPNSRSSAAIATSCLLQAGLRAGPGKDAGLEEPDGRCSAWEAGSPRVSPRACCHGSGKNVSGLGAGSGAGTGDMPCRAAGRAAVLGVLQDQALGGPFLLGKLGFVRMLLG